MRGPVGPALIICPLSSTFVAKHARPCTLHDLYVSVFLPHAPSSTPYIDCRWWNRAQFKGRITFGGES